MELVYHPAAQAELEAEVDYCEKERSGSGTHVRNDIAETLRLLCKYPELGRLDEDEVRRIVTKRYHFIIHYEISDSQIIVWALAHPAREPGYWSRRREN